MYQWNAEDYYKNSSGQQKLAREVIAKLDLQGEEIILDIGCGDGKVTAEIASQVPNGSVVGIDSSQEMIDFASSKFPPSQFSNLSFYKVDASHINFANEFDVIVSFSCLHWIKKHIPVLAGIKRSLKQSGRIFLHFGGKGNAEAVANTAEKVIARESWSKYFQGFSFPYGFYGVEEYQDWLARVGLKATRVELIPKDITYQGKAALGGWFRSTWLPLTNRIPEDLQSEFIDELVNTYVESNPVDSEGLVHVSMMRLEVEATKL